ncbi:DUF1156 domain-containing protein [Alkalinema sp. FACHB-956]|uniref:DUF1156 domain-containing protein n=1 Tax=Alkalinema sp. FACHB-956 TaxID=2692768 RepID=UPI0016840032|nr:DUF1156 domain-containing protein [Alkalinema sp. FACHB-956]MBD2329688.1 DUF1156 domain-containing protein [Alkalinema sp. FACHB-956]
MTYRKKLIEVALPLEAINMESAREKSIRHGHPSTLHLWWARRPLAACRAVLFASLVDDPSSHPDKFPTEEAQIAERQRLFDILGRITIETDKKGNTKQVIRGLVSWDDINNPNSGVLIAAQREIARSIAWNRGDEPPTAPEAVRHYLAENAPPVYDPFAGGGSIPLEAQRLGLKAHASDLNPVAVLINKALTEIPPKFKDLPPVNPESQQKLKVNQWKGLQGVAEDLCYYGKWIRDEAEKRIGHLYPEVALPSDKGGGSATVIAWLWARTAKCPNPACGCQMPLIRSFALSNRKGSEAHIKPVIDRSQTPPIVTFEAISGKNPESTGTMTRRGAVCLACQTPVPFEYLRGEGRNKQMRVQLIAIVAEGDSGRVFLSPSGKHEEIANQAQAEWKPETEIIQNSRHMTPPVYGMMKHYELFTERQLTALSTFGSLLGEVREKITHDACKILPDDSLPFENGGVGSTAYADAVVTYLGLGLSKATDLSSALCHWQANPEHLKIAPTFSRHALSMSWDFAEGNPFSDSSGNFSRQWELIEKVLNNSFSDNDAKVEQQDSRLLDSSEPIIVSTDPPYYDNIPYADLSDFFYVWLRRFLGGIYPNLFSTLLVPKTQELVADQVRHGGRKEAQEFFEKGLGSVFLRIRKVQHFDYPFTIYYAFKQAETEQEEGKASLLVSSTGWETMLEGLLREGFSITGTLPIRTERSGRMRDFGSNALASSIVLVCRPRPENAPSTTRRRFVDELKQELPDAIKKLQQGNIAPVDLAQSSIGPGMAIFSRYAKVLESDGSPMRIRTALQLINQTLDEFLAEQEGEFDTDTRWALAWFEQYQFSEGQFGDAETLSKAKNTSIKGMTEAGILTAKAGKVQLVPRDALPKDWNPAKDNRIPVWEATQHLIRALDQNGETGAAHLLAQLGNLGEVARDLAYRLYSICDRKGWTQEAIAYNSLVISWSEIARLATEKQNSTPTQIELGI